jgi:iterative type I PKS product template protein
VKPSLSTTSVQRIIQEKIDSEGALVIGQSDLHEPLLRAAVEGHLVHGVGLCPSSLYADMALTLCDYAYRVAKPDGDKPHVNVGHMETFKPLILDPKASNQLLQIEMKIDFISGRGVVNYQSLTPVGKLVNQAKCDVTYEDSELWTEEWERRKFLVQTRIDMLKAGGKSIHHIKRGLAYKLFAAMVEYDDKYRGMEEVVFHSEAREATSNVAFQATSKDGNYLMSPYLIDSVCNITGFIMNANDTIDHKQTYISGGWESLRFAKRLEEDKRYSSYLRMQVVPGKGKMVAGDVYIFEDDEIIGVVGGVKFQCVPRALLETLLAPKPNSAASRPTPTSQVRQPQKTPHTITSRARIAQSSANPVMEFEVTKKAKTATKLQTSVPSNLTTQALLIIASEVGCEISELADPIQLSDLGIDSLMSLSISGRFREELDLDFAAQFLTICPLSAISRNICKNLRRSPTPQPPLLCRHLK